MSDDQLTGTATAHTRPDRPPTWTTTSRYPRDTPSPLSNDPDETIAYIYFIAQAPQRDEPDAAEDASSQQMTDAANHTVGV